MSTLSSEQKIGFIQDHVRACAPCSVASVISWAKSQGLVAYAPRAINHLLQSGEASRDEETIWLN
jgi:hypothetical protein